MNYLTVAQAARRTGLSERAVYDRINDRSLTAHGVKHRIPEDSLTKFILDRQQTAAAKVGDLTHFADRVRRRAQQLGGAKGTVLQLDKDALKIFGPHVVKAAAMADKRGCRWCWARLTASVHGGLEPQLDEPHQILLGQPCREDLTAMREQLFARRRRSDQTPATTQAAAPARRASAARTDAAAPRGRKRCGTSVGQFCPCHTSDRPTITAAAWSTPTNDDEQLTARRRTELTQQLQAATARRDHTHARQLRGLLDALTASAPKPKPRRRAEPHGCGCQCEQHRGQQ